MNKGNIIKTVLALLGGYTLINGAQDTLTHKDIANKLNEKGIATSNKVVVYNDSTGVNTPLDTSKGILVEYSKNVEKIPNPENALWFFTMNPNSSDSANVVNSGTKTGYFVLNPGNTIGVNDWGSLPWEVENTLGTDVSGYNIKDTVPPQVTVLDSAYKDNGEHKIKFIMNGDEPFKCVVEKDGDTLWNDKTLTTNKTYTADAQVGLNEFDISVTDSSGNSVKQDNNVFIDGITNNLEKEVKKNPIFNGLDLGNDIKEINVYNLQGKLVKKIDGKQFNGSNLDNLVSDELSKGTYMLNIKADGKEYSMKYMR